MRPDLAIIDTYSTNQGDSDMTTTAHKKAIATTVASIPRLATYDFLGGQDLADHAALTVALKIHAKMREQNGGRWVITIADTYYTYRGF